MSFTFITYYLSKPISVESFSLNALKMHADSERWKYAIKANQNIPKVREDYRKTISNDEAVKRKKPILWFYNVKKRWLSKYFQKL